MEPIAPSPPNQSLVKRYKLIWRFLLISNFALGAYVFTRPRKRSVEEIRAAKKNVKDDGKAAEQVLSTPIESTATMIPETPSIPLPVIEPMKVHPPIDDDQQRELFNWMLEEKRKIKPKDRDEKKRIDEDKAILKHFIRSKSIPSL